MLRVFPLVCAAIALAITGSASADQLADGPMLSVSFLEQDDAASRAEATADCCRSCCCCCCCCPTWTIEAGAVFLNKDRDRRTPLIADEGGGVLVDASAVGTSGGAGVFASIIRHTQCGPDWEVAYFGVDGFSGTSVFPQLPGSFQVLVQPPIFFFNNVGPNTMSLQSELFSTEVNARWPLCQRLTLLSGFRWLELGEQNQLILRGVGSVARLRFNAGNQLYGFQTGADWTMWEGPCGRLRVGGLFKAGIYGNWANAGSVIEIPLGSTLYQTADRASRTAFVGEIDIMTKYQLTKCLALAGGYKLLWLDGVALAGNQPPAMLRNLGHGIDVTGSAFYHGASASLIYSW